MACKNHLGPGGLKLFGDEPSEAEVITHASDESHFAVQVDGNHVRSCVAPEKFHAGKEKGFCRILRQSPIPSYLSSRNLQAWDQGELAQILPKLPKF
jgi:hypothetical protein